MCPMSSHDEWWSPWRANGGSLVLHVDLRPHPDREERALELLDEHERARWKRFVVRGARRRYALCRAALDQPLPAARVFQQRADLRLSGARQALRHGQRHARCRQLQREP